MNTEQVAAPKSMAIKRILVGLAVTLVIVSVGGVVVWTTTCPCGGIPGFVLWGDVQEEPVTNWSFANDVPVCQIQIYAGWRPHALNLNCMATPEGELFLSCSEGPRKYWCGQVEQNEAARLRLNGKVYSVVLDRALDPAVLDRAWAARVEKLQVLGGGPDNLIPARDVKRPDSWWSFHVRSAAASD